MAYTEINPKIYGDDMPSISACPCCGKRAKLLVNDHMNGDTSQNYRINCTDAFGCGLSMFDSISGYSPDFRDQIRKFIERWNKRTPISEKPSMSIDDAIFRLTAMKADTTNETDVETLEFAIRELEKHQPWL